MGAIGDHRGHRTGLSGGPFAVDGTTDGSPDRDGNSLLSLTLVTGWGMTWGAGMLGTILFIILMIILLGVLPTWPYSSGWGYYPSGGVGLLLIILIVLMLVGRI